MLKTAVVATLLVALSASSAFAEVAWHKDIREAMAEAEGRGVAMLIYITRDE